jgi:hypothetical protein
MFETIIKPEFNPANHTFQLGGYDLTPVSKMLSSYEEEFDAPSISFFMARNEMRRAIGWKTKGDPEPGDVDVAVRQAEILAEWDAKRDEAADHGNKVHKMFDKFLTNGEVVYPETKAFLQSIKDEYDQIYKEYCCELMMCDPESGMAGITDWAGIRKCKELIIDIDDFKTNLFKGIVFDSISRKGGKVKHYNKFLKSPLSHLEQCNYTRYALQLSSYAYMMEKQLNARIGRLRIFWVEFNPETEMIEYSGFIPIPYMRNEVIAIFAENAVRVETQDW